MNLKKINTVFEDARGTIADIFYKAAINHVAILYSKKGSVRGNHFHKKSHQHMYIIEGSLRYYTKAPDAGDETIQSCVVKKGDLVALLPSEPTVFVRHLHELVKMKEQKDTLPCHHLCVRHILLYSHSNSVCLYGMLRSLHN